MKAVLSVLLLTALTGAATALFWRQYIFVDKHLTWNDAQAYCRRNYVDLMTIETQAEDNSYQSIASSCSPGCWCGLSRSTQTVDFTQWSDGSSVSHTHWATNQASNTINFNCVFTIRAWHIEDCTKTHPFTCYVWKPDLIVVQELKTWQEALNYCRTVYTDLLSIDTDTDQSVVKTNFSAILTPSFWTGLRFLDGSWFWVNQGFNTSQGRLSFMPSCPAPHFYCGAQNTESDVLENRDCGENLNFMCYN